MKGTKRKVNALFDGVEDNAFMEESIAFLKQQANSTSTIDTILEITNPVQFLDEIYWYTMELEEHLNLTYEEQTLITIMQFSVQTGNDGILSYLYKHEKDVSYIINAFFVASMENGVRYLQEGFNYQEAHPGVIKLIELDKEYHSDYHKENLMQLLKQYIKNNRYNFPN